MRTDPCVTTTSQLPEEWARGDYSFPNRPGSNLKAPSHPTSKSRFRIRIRLCLWSGRYMLVLFFFSLSMASISVREITVTALLKGSMIYPRQRSALFEQIASASRTSHNRRRQSLPPTPEAPITLMMSRSGDDDTNDDSTAGDSSYSGFSLSGFFSRDSSDDTTRTNKDDTESTKSFGSVPLVRRFFGGRGGDDDEEEDSDTKSPSRVRSVVSRYFQTRQLRKDAEALREEVLRREEEKRLRIKKQQKAVSEAQKRMQSARGIVQRESRQEEVKREVEKLRRIEAQKVVDLQRLERLEKSRLERELRQQGIPSAAADKAKVSVSSATLRQSSATSSPSAPIKPALKSRPSDRKTKGDKAEKKDDDGDGDASGFTSGFNVVSVAQKFMSGLFDKEEEEWIVVAPKTRISPGELVPVTVAGIDLLLVASKDGSALHCIANSCPHLGTPLEIGTLERRPIQSPSTILDGNVTITSPGGGEGQSGGVPFFQENDISRMLKQDGCEDCIVCPLHRTAFALESGEVRGEWCPYPPVIGKLTGAVKKESNLPVFDVRTRGKNIEVRLNTPVIIESDEQKKKKQEQKDQQ
ncbi:ferredoxin subunit of nitrite reductase and ring-hydroxylating dioxygenase [Nitzschia inconspicua]|uniref:Ferredoxin subunit of nitrite reductase and ring-hydroxylating dioxygenase n=1 Tax=Nitzschia inconspicua TaxID=303405 RepID=A0A9K3LZ26_9STRA|nr:ferredoxin subunit of nitrite reductase and ring-hydroxylating dioxygenase [Nitzschia inconspicua]